MTEEISSKVEARLSSSTLWGLDAKALSKWTSFAQQGGIGSCVAVEDFMATSSSDLMFLEGDEIVVLEKINDGEAYMGYCEGVIGRFNPAHVKFTTTIKPAPFATLAAPTSADLGDSDKLTPTSLTFTAASPPTESLHLPQDGRSSPGEAPSSMVDTLDAPTKDSKRVSGPFELDYGSEGTPSPGLDQRDGWFAEQQVAVKEVEQVNEQVRHSTGSADWGGIGWMTGAANGEASSDHAVSPDSETNPFGNLVASQHSSEPSVASTTESAHRLPEAGNGARASTTSPTPPLSRDDSLTKSISSTLRTPSNVAIVDEHWDDEDEIREGDDEWDIYGDYARQSMYFAPGSPLAAIAAESKRMSMAQRRASRQATAANRSAHLDKAPASPKHAGGQATTAPSNGMQTLAGMLAPPSPEASTLSRDQTSPKTPELRQGHTASLLPLGETSGRSLASELRSRIQKERNQSPTEEEEALTKTSVPAAVSYVASSSSIATVAVDPTVASEGRSDGTPIGTLASSPVVPVSNPTSSRKAHRDLPAIETGTTDSTPIPEAVKQRSGIFHLTAASPTESPADSTLVTPATSNAGEIRPLGSPIPLALPDDKQHYPAPPRRHLSPALPQSPLAGGFSSPRTPLASPSPSGLSTPKDAALSRGSPSHASPHSVDATQAAVTAARPRPDGQRLRGLTLVGRMDIDLTAAKGPMPISFLVDRPPPGEPTVNVPSVAPALVRPTISDGLGLGLPESPGWGDEGPMPTSPRTPFDFDVSGSPVMGGVRTPTCNFTSPVPTASASSSPVQRKAKDVPVRPRPRSRSFSGNSVQRYSPVEAKSITQLGEPSSSPMARSSSASAHPSNRSKLSLVRAKSDAQHSPPSPLQIMPLQPELPVEIPDSATLPAGSVEVDRPSPNIDTPTTPSSLADSKKGFWSSLGRRDGSQSAALKAPASADMSPLDPAQPLPSPVARSSTSSSILNKFSTSSSVVASAEGQPVPKVGPAGRSASFSMSKPNLLVRKTKSQHFKDKSHVSNLPSPVSHKDFEEETVKQDGMEFELMKPLARKQSTRVVEQLISEAPASPVESPSSPQGARPSLTRRLTTQSDLSKASQSRALPETDEWGFLRSCSPVPEILQARSSAPSDHRAAEAKWLSIISVPIPAGSGAPKKVRKMVLEQGVPSSLRGRVWGWFMSASLSARVPGLYEQLLAHDKGQPTPDIDADVTSCYKDHSVFAEEGGAGQQDLRALLRAYAHFSPSGYKREMALIAGGLLMHVPAEEAFWLLTGLVTRAKDYYSSDAWGLRVDTQVFTSILMGSDAKLAKFILKDCGVKPISFLGPWLLSLFTRILPWPTMLRIWDAVVCEGPRFLLQTSLAILTISRERLLALPKSADAVVDYLLHLPQDALLAPDNVMKACEQVKLRDEDLIKLRAGAEKALREEGTPRVRNG